MIHYSFDTRISIIQSAPIAYVHSAGLVFKSNPRDSYNSLIRAHFLASKLGRTKPLYEEIQLALIDFVRQRIPAETGALEDLLLSISTNTQVGDQKEWAGIARTRAAFWETKGDFRNAVILWRNSARFSKMATALDEAKTASQCANRALGRHAEQFFERGDFYQAIDVFKRAIDQSPKRTEPAGRDSTPFEAASRNANHAKRSRRARSAKRDDGIYSSTH